MNAGINTARLHFSNGVSVGVIIKSPFAPDDNYYPAIVDAVAATAP